MLTSLLAAILVQPLLSLSWTTAVSSCTVFQLSPFLTCFPYRSQSDLLKFAFIRSYVSPAENFHCNQRKVHTPSLSPWPCLGLCPSPQLCLSVLSLWLTVTQSFGPPVPQSCVFLPGGLHMCLLLPGELHSRYMHAHTFLLLSNPSERHFLTISLNNKLGCMKSLVFDYS